MILGFLFLLAIDVGLGAVSAHLLGWFITQDQNWIMTNGWSRALYLIGTIIASAIWMKIIVEVMEMWDAW